MSLENQVMWLRCRLIEESVAIRTVVAKQIDDTEFSVQCPIHEVQVVPGSPINAAWMRVQVLGRDDKNQKMTIKMPAPSVTLGHNVNVKSSELVNHI
jgi:hypothetical protein